MATAVVITINRGIMAMVVIITTSQDTMVTKTIIDTAIDTIVIPLIAHILIRADIGHSIMTNATIIKKISAMDATFIIRPSVT